MSVIAAARAALVPDHGLQPCQSSIRVSRPLWTVFSLTMTGQSPIIRATIAPTVGTKRFLTRMDPLGYLVLFGIWIALGGCIGVLWLVRYRYLRTSIRLRYLLTPESYARPIPNPPKLSVLVAAKDEEANIETCITTLLDQDYPNYEIIAIDDRSTDRTPELLARLEREAKGKLRVVTVTELREGWFGKNNAMREGVEVAGGDWLLFTDADCRQESTRTLSVAMRDALTHDVGMLSMQPMLFVPTWWEKVIQPVCSFVLILWFVPQKVNDPKRKAAYATGMFMLFSRKCYEAVGGHEAVRTCVNEDIRLARNVKRSGHILRVAENIGLYRVRMYGSPGEAFRGWSRIFFGSLTNVRRLGISAASLLVYTVLPWVSLSVAIAGLALCDAGSTLRWQFAVGAWLFAVVWHQIMMWRYYELVFTPRGWSFTFVIGAITAVAMLISAMMQALGYSATTWRGTSYHDGAVIAPKQRNGTDAATEAPARTDPTSMDIARP